VLGCLLGGWMVAGATAAFTLPAACAPPFGSNLTHPPPPSTAITSPTQAPMHAPQRAWACQTRRSATAASPPATCPAAPPPWRARPLRRPRTPALRTQRCSSCAHATVDGGGHERSWVGGHGGCGGVVMSGLACMQQVVAAAAPCIRAAASAACIQGHHAACMRLR